MGIEGDMGIEDGMGIEKVGHGDRGHGTWG